MLAELEPPWSLLPSPLVFVDLETTGFSPAQGGRVVEIAMVRMEPSYPPIILDTLVDPGTAYLGPTWVHGITAGAVRGAPRFADIADEVARLLDGAVLVAHNAEFEERFLAAELGRVDASGRVVHARRLCTLELARKLRPDRTGRGAHTLGGLCVEYHVALTDAHAALPDTAAVAELLAALARRHPDAFDRALSVAAMPLTLGTRRPRPSEVRTRPPAALPPPPQPSAPRTSKAQALATVASLVAASVLVTVVLGLAAVWLVLAG